MNVVNFIGIFCGLIGILAGGFSCYLSYKINQKI